MCHEAGTAPITVTRKSAQSNINKPCWEPQFPNICNSQPQKYKFHTHWKPDPRPLAWLKESSPKDSLSLLVLFTEVD